VTSLFVFACVVLCIIVKFDVSLVCPVECVVFIDKCVVFPIEVEISVVGNSSEVVPEINQNTY
jgi:hypothetical protein